VERWNSLQQSNKASQRGQMSSDIAPLWDHSTHEQFFDYYAEASVSDEAVVRFRRTRDAILRVMGPGDRRMMDVADIGCGAGSHSMAWAELGCRVHALDVNKRLVELGQKRAAERGFTIDFRVGSATALPWADASMDVCVALELLEHVADWEACLYEFIRVLRPGGTLFITTTNQLCPRQAEFNLVLYSWYPRRLKNYFERLANTTRPQLANYAKYPAVHWFTYYGLRRFLAARHFRSLDRFDTINAEEKGTLARLVLAAVKRSSILRYAGQVCTPGTIILAIKE
jgi:2-polyprenyl-3-methyl-5-hydroxy-6-metoxy-1,4-benzoquinol methylase